ncbi:MAG: SDR family NAD(P)-dependent oxidoreductase [Cyanobacteria bacterium SZAS TMP-1]|nr:SDR family NAD(P)-dependent oxidoreductase [Cyanobacteria bacterium SZAS TMP-1]
MPLSTNVKAIITGASTGIGRGLALHLAKLYKAKLVLTARSERDLQSCAEEVRKLGGEAEIFAGDITKEGLSQELATLCVTNYGGIDLLVNNAGMGMPGLVEKLKIEDWRRLFDVNFFSALQTTYACLDELKKSPRGKIVNISSVAGKISFPGSVPYCSSKFALTALSNGLAAELAPHHVDVTTICPGLVRTEFFEKNSMPDTRNPVLIAEQKDLKGFMMKHILSISTDECVREIVQSLNRDQSQELILTIPGKVAERLNGLAPRMMSLLSRQMNFDQK